MRYLAILALLCLAGCRFGSVASKSFVAPPQKEAANDEK
jgi:hypothetical protein